MGNQLIARWGRGGGLGASGATTKMHPLQQEQAPEDYQNDNEAGVGDRTTGGKFIRLRSIFRAASSARKSWRKAASSSNQRNPGSDDEGGGGSGAVGADAEDLLPDGGGGGIFQRKVHHFEKDTITANWMDEDETSGGRMQVRLRQGWNVDGSA